MGAAVIRVERGHRLSGADVTSVAVNRFLGHLEIRNYSPSTVRVYAFDLANFTRFLEARSLGLGGSGVNVLVESKWMLPGGRRNENVCSTERALGGSHPQCDGP